MSFDLFVHLVVKVNTEEYRKTTRPRVGTAEYNVRKTKGVADAVENGDR